MLSQEEENRMSIVKENTPLTMDSINELLENIKLFKDLLETCWKQISSSSGLMKNKFQLPCSSGSKGS